MKFTVPELKKILQSLNTFYNVDSIGDTDDLFSQGLLDSLILIQFVMAIESNFKIQIRNQDINYDNFKTFSMIKSVLNSHYSN
jgi:acyl carrier protein